MRKAILIDGEKHAERGRANVAETNAREHLSATTRAKDREVSFLAPRARYDHDGGIRRFTFTVPQ
jgi:hypothetical protein